MQSVSSQIEFANLPPRAALAPVEEVKELEEVLRRLLGVQTPAQIVETSQQLVCAALRGEELHLLIGPARLHIGRMNGSAKRTIKLPGETVVKALLQVLVDWKAAAPEPFKKKHDKEKVNRQTPKQTDHVLCSPKLQSPCLPEKAPSTWLSAGKTTPNCALLST